jgi:hypothetical protein
MAAVLIDLAKEKFCGCLIRSEVLPKVWAMALKTLGHVRMPVEGKWAWYDGFG